MGYKRGEILTYNYPVRSTTNTKVSKIINNYHTIVVLHQRKTPYNTVLVAPITTAESLKVGGKIPSNYVKLLVDDYPMILDNDSYINLDMTMPVDEIELNELMRFQKKISGQLKEFDLYQLDYKMVLTYELNKYVHTEYAKRLNTLLLGVFCFYLELD